MEMTLPQRLDAYRRLARLDRPIGTLLLLWPTMTALWIAGNGQPDRFIVMIFFIGVWLTRANGCIINDFADRKLDKYVARTKGRPLASGEISSKEALSLFAGLGILSLGLVLLLNPLTIAMASIAIVLTVVYPFTKRFLAAPQMFLGIVWSWSIPMAFAAQLGEIPALAWYLFAANWCLTVAYDTMYGMVDRDDDIKVGIKSSAIWFGRFDTLCIGVFQCLTLVFLSVVGFQLKLGLSYSAGLVMIGALFIYQQRLLRTQETSAYFRGFLNNNWVGLILLVSVILAV